MSENQESLRILKMLEEGKLSAEEAAQLLSALESPPESENTSPEGRAARWMHVRVSDARSGKNKVNVRLPIGLVKAGLKLGARFAPEVADLDASSIISALQNGNNGKIIDVVDEEDGEHVEIFIE